ncbi:MAG: PilZ domain-containing protein [Polyangiaceae bacterium]
MRSRSFEEECFNVSDIVTLARTARESLARGLNALQGSSNADPQLLDLAAPIARAMGGLHQIERSGGSVLMPHAREALANIQSALQQLQSYPHRDDSVLAAMEAVAGALGSAHTLARAAEPPAAAPAYQAAPAPPAYSAAPAAPAYAPAPAAPVYSPAPPPAAAYPAAPAYAPAPAAPIYSPAPAAAYPAAPAYAPTPAAPVYSPAPPPAAAYAPHVAPAPPLAGSGRAAEGAIINAELGAHSPSNFFKGLSGNDIVDHGGLFVATYNLPSIGNHVRLRVSLPGGYEFEANAVVRWRREPNDVGGTDAPPGFGAQFTEITAEARQLVYRYVRNREPLFHDDL